MEIGNRIGQPVTLTIEGVPVPKGRPVFGKGRVYTPARTRAFETGAAWLALAAMRPRPPLRGPVRVELLFELPIPKSWPAKRRDEARRGLILPDVRPDIDNLQKAILDALRNIVFLDDAQIVDLSSRKRFGTQPRTVATISPMTPP